MSSSLWLGITLGFGKFLNYAWAAEAEPLRDGEGDGSGRFALVCFWADGGR